MDLEHLRTFAAVVERGSLQAAARANQQSRAMVRRHIDALEAELGVALLHRDTAGCDLTAAGLALSSRAKELLRQADDAANLVQQAARGGSGVIHILETLGLPHTLRVQGLLAVGAQLPDVRFTIRQLEDPLAHLDEPCDVVLHIGPPLEAGPWHTRIVARLPLLLCGAPEYLSEFGAPEHTADLAGHRLLLWTRPQEPTDSLPLRQGGRLPIAPWLASPDLPLLRAIASAGGGLLLSPHVPQLEEPGVGPLVPVLTDLVAGEAVFRVSTRLPSRADVRVRTTMEQICAMLDEVLPT